MAASAAPAIVRARREEDVSTGDHLVRHRLASRRVHWSVASFFFLSLAFVKRFAELENLRERGGATAKGRGYHVSDIEQLRSFGSASGYASVVVLTLYISNLNADAALLYHHINRLWLLVPIVLLWLSRLWLQASRGQLDEDPVVYAITDGRSLFLGLLVIAVVLSAL